MVEQVIFAGKKGGGRNDLIGFGELREWKWIREKKTIT